jgi:hypothetical protein
LLLLTEVARLERDRLASHSAPGGSSGSRAMLLDVVGELMARFETGGVGLVAREGVSNSSKSPLSPSTFDGITSYKHRNCSPKLLQF